MGKGDKKHRDSESSDEYDSPRKSSKSNKKNKNKIDEEDNHKVNLLLKFTIYQKSNFKSSESQK